MADSTLTPGTKSIPTSNGNHERWLAETWQMIEECAKQIDQRHRISLSPMGCAALLKERSSHETFDAAAELAFYRASMPESLRWDQVDSNVKDAWRKNTQKAKVGDAFPEDGQ